MSRVNILVPWTKGEQNSGAKGECFVTDRPTMKSHFFVTGQIGMKFGKTSFDVVY